MYVGDMASVGNLCRATPNSEVWCEAVVILKKLCIATVVWMRVGHVTRSRVNTHTYCSVNVTRAYVNTHTYCCVMCVWDMTHWYVNAHTHCHTNVCWGYDAFIREYTHVPRLIATGKSVHGNM